MKSLKYMPRSRFLDHMLILFLILRESLPFHSGCTTMESPRQGPQTKWILLESSIFLPGGIFISYAGAFYMFTNHVQINVQVSLHPHQYLLLLFWIVAILMSMVSHCVLSLISLMIIDGEHLFLCLLSIWIYTFLWRNACSSSLPLKKNCGFCCCCCCCCCWVTEVLYIFWIQPLFLFFPFFSPSGP